MIVVAFRDGKDIVGTVIFQGLPGVDIEWYRSRAALELSRKWRRTALECGDTEYVPLTAQGILARHESFLDVVQPSNTRACGCCGLGEPQGTCYVCGQGNAMPKHADGVCWSCRDPFEKDGLPIRDEEFDAEMDEQEYVGGDAPLLRGDDLVRAFQAAESHAELDEILHRAVESNPHIKNFRVTPLSQPTESGECDVRG